MIKKIALLSLTLVFFISCNTSKETLQQEDLKQIDVNGLYSLSVPKYMDEMKTLNDDASFEYANIFKEVYTIVIDEKTDDFVKTFEAIDMYDKEKTALENYDIIQKKYLGEGIENLIITPTELSEINSLKAKQSYFNGEVDDLKIAYLISFIEGGDNLFMVMSWTLADRLEKYDSTLKLIHNSFKLN